MVKLDVIYTRGGDKGETSLGDGSRISKTALRVESYGTVDEANAAIGLCRLHTDGDADTMLARIQNELFDLGADLATPEKEETRSRLRIDEAYGPRLESEIDRMTAELAPLTSFILPGGSPASAHLHMARNIANGRISFQAHDLVAAAANRVNFTFEVVAHHHFHDAASQDLGIVGGTDNGNRIGRKKSV